MGIYLIFGSSFTAYAAISASTWHGEDFLISVYSKDSLEYEWDKMGIRPGCICPERIYIKNILNQPMTYHLTIYWPYWLIKYLTIKETVRY